MSVHSHLPWWGWRSISRIRTAAFASPSRLSPTSRLRLEPDPPGSPCSPSETNEQPDNFNFLDQDKLLKNVQLVWCHRSNWKRSFIRPEIFWFFDQSSSEDQKKLSWLVPILPFSNQVNLVREPSLESKILGKIEPYIMPCPIKKLWAGRLWVNIEVLSKEFFITKYQLK